MGFGYRLYPSYAGYAGFAPSGLRLLILQDLTLLRDWGYRL